MKFQLTPKSKYLISYQDVFLVLLALVIFIVAVSFYSSELIEIVQQIEVPDPEKDELVTSVSSMK